VEIHDTYWLQEQQQHTEHRKETEEKAKV